MGGNFTCVGGAPLCSSKNEIFCGLPSSRTSKSCLCRPGAGSPFPLVTTTSTNTTRTLDWNVGWSLVEVLAAAFAGVEALSPVVWAQREATENGTRKTRAQQRRNSIGKLQKRRIKILAYRGIILRVFAELHNRFPCMEGDKSFTHSG